MSWYGKIKENSPKYFALWLAGFVLIYWTTYWLAQYYFVSLFPAVQGGVFVASIISIGSVVVSFAHLLSFKKYGWLVFVPLLINGLTIFINLNMPEESPSARFYDLTRMELPKSAYSLNYFADPPSFLGDGVRELSFKVSQEDIDTLLAQKPFGNLEWKMGPVVKAVCLDQDNRDCDGTINNFWGPNDSIKFVDSPNLYSALIDRTPHSSNENPEFKDAIGNYTEIIIDKSGGWVLVIDYDS